MTRHAVYVTAEDFLGQREAFRVGLPTDWDTAQRRWLRLDDNRRGRGLTVRWQGRRYVAVAVEVRSVDRHGRGLGSHRHATAFTVPYRTVRVGKPASYPWRVAPRTKQHHDIIRLNERHRRILRERSAA